MAMVKYWDNGLFVLCNRGGEAKGDLSLMTLTERRRRRKRQQQFWRGVHKVKIWIFVIDDVIDFQIKQINFINPPRSSMEGTVDVTIH
jgi:hypothetical protein